MSIYLKLTLSCVLAAIWSLAVKKHNSEISFLIMLVAVLGCLSTTVNIAQNYKSEFLNVFEQHNISLNSFLPMFKCLIVSSTSQITSAICKDSGHSAIASGLELTGVIVVIICMLPLFETLFQLIGGMM